jgi:hypothetical protein
VHCVVADVAVLAVDDDTLKQYSVSIRLKDRRSAPSSSEQHTSTPVCATIWAVRKEGRPMNVFIGFDPSRRALRSRKRGFLIVLVIADGKDISDRLCAVGLVGRARIEVTWINCA